MIVCVGGYRVHTHTHTHTHIYIYIYIYIYACISLSPYLLVCFGDNLCTFSLVFII